MNKTKIVNVLTLLAFVITVVQGLLPGMKAMVPDSTMTIVSAVLMFLLSGLTTWKQVISDEVQNKAVKATIIVAIIATLGGLNDLTNYIPFGEVANQWIRFSITAITAILNISSKIFWPTDQTKSII